MSQDMAKQTAAPSLTPRTILIGGLVLVAAYVVGIMLSMGKYDTLVAVIVGPILFLVSLPVLSRQASREGDRRVFWLLLTGLVLKLLGAIAQIYVLVTTYQSADATDYYREGLRLASRFRAGDFATALHPIVGTNFIKIVTGVVLALIGPSRAGAFLVFSWLGFWGLFLFYRAFIVAVPEGKPHTYARLLFFLPSLIFWPSAIGKDAWMVLGLGIAAFGAARVVQGHLWRGLTIAALGVAMDIMVRPHIVALIGVALVAAYLLRRPRVELRELAPVAKALSALLLIGVALFLVRRNDSFLKESGLTHPTNLTQTLDKLAYNTSIGGSAFAPSELTSWRRAPGAFLTVLYRPTLNDAKNFTSTLAALEGTFLLGLTFLRIRWILTALRSVRRQPYIGMALVFTTLFVIVFSSIGNFGILVRQRSSVLPFFLVLLCVPPRRRFFSRLDESAPLKENRLSA